MALMVVVLLNHCWCNWKVLVKAGWLYWALYICSKGRWYHKLMPFPALYVMHGSPSNITLISLPVPPNTFMLKNINLLHPFLCSFHLEEYENISSGKIVDTKYIPHTFSLAKKYMHLQFGTKSQAGSTFDISKMWYVCNHSVYEYTVPQNKP